MPKLTREQVLYLKTMGWDFYSTGSNEWDWIKFHMDGTQFARGGDAVWDADVATVIEGASSDIEKWEPTVELRIRVIPAFGSPHSSYVTEQKFVRVSGGPPCGGGASEWRPLPMVDKDGKPL